MHAYIQTSLKKKKILYFMDYRWKYVQPKIKFTCKLAHTILTASKPDVEQIAQHISWY